MDFNWLKNLIPTEVTAESIKTSQKIKKTSDKIEKLERSAIEIENRKDTSISERIENAQNLITSIDATINGSVPGTRDAGINLVNISGNLNQIQADRHGIGNFDDFVNRNLAIKGSPSPTLNAPGKGSNAITAMFDSAARSRAYDPLVLDLDGDGVELIQLADCQANFDMDADGFREKVGWVSADDGLLVIDKNNDMAINNINELFGNSSTSGFTMLRTYDTNGDNTIDISDPDFSEFKIWRDLNSDGMMQPGELKSLSDYSIESISLDSQSVVDPSTQLTKIIETATFTKEDGSTFVIADALLERRSITPSYDGNITISAEAAALPNLKGYSAMPDLHIAATLDPELINLLQEILDSQSSENFESKIDNFLFRWAGAQDVDSESRGPQFDARKLITLETFNGVEFNNFQVGKNPSGMLIPILNDSWNLLREHFASRLLVLGPFSNLFSDAQYSNANDELILNIDVRNLGLQLQNLKESNAGEFNSLISYIEEILSNSSDMWDQKIIFGGDDNNYIEDTQSTAIFVNTGLSDDYIETAAKKAWIDAGEGNNSIAAIHGGDNYILSGSGDDGIYIGGGNAVIDAGNGSNNIVAEAGNYGITTGNGDDSISVSDGAATIDAGEGNNLIHAQNGDYLISSGMGADQISVGSGNATINAGGGNNYINTGSGDYLISTGNGDDQIEVQSGNSSIDAGDGQNNIYATAGNYSIITGAGDDHIIVEGGSGLIDAGNGDNNINAANGGYLIYSGSGNDFINSGGGNTIIFSGGGDDHISISAGENNLVDGGDGNDVIETSDGSDFLIGGQGNDSLMGGAGNDVYLFGRNYGRDEIIETSGVDKISITADVTSTDVEIFRDYADLYVSIKGTNDCLIIRNWFNYTGNQVEAVEFSDGTIWDASILQTAKLVGTEDADYLSGTSSNDTIEGRGGNDYLSGDTGNDTLDGGTGNDTLDGGIGNDTYIFGRGFGQDNITETSGTDTVQLTANVLPTDVLVSRDASHLYLSILGTLDRLTIQNWYSDALYQIEQVKFADGTIWDTSILQTAKFVGTEGADYITGTTANDVIEGLGGDDTLSSDAGDDILKGDAGNDTLVSQEGNDTLEGGTGNDYLDGGTGNDTYKFNRGDGQDAIVEYDSQPNNDKIQFGPNITKEQLWLNQNGNDLEISVIGTADKMIIQNYYSGGEYKIERIETWAGSTLLENQFQNLISVMAGFNPPPMGQTTISQDYQDALMPIIIASWS